MSFEVEVLFTTTYIPGAGASMHACYISTAVVSHDPFIERKMYCTCIHTYIYIRTYVCTYAYAQMYIRTYDCM